ncbi:MAG: FAD-dependent oxidoreductase [Deinococcales bacterium]
MVTATGASPIMIPIEGLVADRKCSAMKTIFEQEHLPKHLAIVGAGVIGLEMAFAFRRLGVKISLI